MQECSHESQVETIVNAVQLCCGIQNLVAQCSDDVKPTAQEDVVAVSRAIQPRLGTSIGWMVDCDPRLGIDDCC